MVPSCVARTESTSVVASPSRVEKVATRTSRKHQCPWSSQPTDCLHDPHRTGSRSRPRDHQHCESGPPCGHECGKYPGFASQSKERFRGPRTTHKLAGCCHLIRG